MDRDRDPPPTPPPPPARQGYASEAAHATLEFALHERGLDRVIRKLGMVPRAGGAAHPVYGGCPLRVHAIDLAETEFQA